MRYIMKTSYIDGIKSIEDFRRIPENELDCLAAEIREFLVRSVSKTGGHLASNLGVVELTIALQRAFDTPKDKIIFDVGHQTYVNKILTGRAAEFPTLRQMNGLAGFPKTEESEFDTFNTGHSSTSISAALGMLRAMRIKGTPGRVVAVIGDGALTGGMAFEALNDAGQSELPLIVVLNDNNMSISKNVGALPRHLDSMRVSSGYLAFKRGMVNMLDKMTKAGPRIHAWLSKVKSRIKYILLPNVLFEELGFTYLGPVSGHDIQSLTEALNLAKKVPNPVLLHVLTVKGKGYGPAEKEPSRFHGIGKFDPDTGRSPGTAKKDNSAIAGETLCRIGRQEKDLAVITAAMSEGTGMEPFREAFPKRFFDVGIAEQHAVTMAAGLAMGGMKPVVAIYSSFLQRAYDQMLHDVALQRLHVVFAIDRAGLVGADGETHQGVYDIAYCLTMPYVEIYSPASKGELEEMLKMAVEGDVPAAVRYGKGTLPDRVYPAVEYGKWIEIKPIAKVTVVATGRMVEIAERAVENLDVGLVNARFIRPMDEDMLDMIKQKSSYVITIEDGIAKGGMGSRIAQRLTGIKVECMGVSEKPVGQGTCDEQTRLCGMDETAVRVRVLMAMEGTK